MCTTVVVVVVVVIIVRRVISVCARPVVEIETGERDVLKSRGKKRLLIYLSDLYY